MDIPTFDSKFQEKSAFNYLLSISSARENVSRNSAGEQRKVYLLSISFTLGNVSPNSVIPQRNNGISSAFNQFRSRKYFPQFRCPAVPEFRSGTTEISSAFNQFRSRKCFPQFRSTAIPEFRSGTMEILLAFNQFHSRKCFPTGIINF